MILMRLGVGASIWLALFPATSADACSCVVRTPAEYLASADVAFSGEPLVAWTEGKAVEFRIDKLLKGRAPSAVTISQPDDSCAVPFIPGRRYIVYAKQEPGRLSVEPCAGTVDSGEVVAGKSRFAAPIPKPVTPSERAPLVAVATLLALLSAGFRIRYRHGG